MQCWIIVSMQFLSDVCGCAEFELELFAVICVFAREYFTQNWTLLFESCDMYLLSAAYCYSLQQFHNTSYYCLLDIAVLFARVVVVRGHIVCLSSFLTAAEKCSWSRSLLCAVFPWFKASLLQIFFSVYCQEQMSVKEKMEALEKAR